MTATHPIRYSFYKICITTFLLLLSGNFIQLIKRSYEWPGALLLLHVTNLSIAQQFSQSHTYTSRGEQILIRTLTQLAVQYMILMSNADSHVETPSVITLKIAGMV